MTTTPYQAPQSDVVDESNKDFADVQVFSASQRIGRVRYFAYNFYATFIVFLAIAILAGAAVAVSGVGEDLPMFSGIFIFLGVLIYLLPFLVALFVARRRLHDLDHSGWMSLLLIVPFLNLFFFLYLIFAPGNEHTNQYGLRPSPNTTLTWIAGLIGPLFVVGIIAGISINAYNDYVEKTAMYEQSSD